MNKPVFLFDMSGVLLDFDLDTIKVNVAQSSSLSLNQVYDSWENEKYIQSELGQVTSQNFFKNYSVEIGLRWSYERWIDEWSSICSLNVNGINLYNYLCKKGYPVYILSNLAEYHKIAVEQKFFDFWNNSTANFLSYKMKLLKPDPEIFTSVCSKLNKLPSECFYFDDTLKNVTVAKEIGFRAFHFSDSNFESLVQWLRHHGINVCLD